MTDGISYRELDYEIFVYITRTIEVMPKLLLKGAVDPMLNSITVDADWLVGKRLTPKVELSIANNPNGSS